MPTCSECRHFVMDAAHFPAGGGCMRYPPFAFVDHAQPTHQPHDSSNPAWCVHDFPAVAPDCRACGEFKPGR